jgi:hypothetical protein
MPKTVKELFNSNIDLSEVSIITAKFDEFMTYQCDNAESLPDVILEAELIDYELDFNADEGEVYLDIICK